MQASLLRLFRAARSRYIAFAGFPQTFALALSLALTFAAASSAFAQAGADPELRVLAVERAPFVMVDANGDIGGFSVELWREIAERLDRDWRIERRETFADMLGAVAERQADLAIGNISITSSREEVLDFSQPFLDSGLQILVRSEAAPSTGLLQAIWASPAPAIIGFGLLALIGVSHLLWLAERGRNPSIRSGYLGGVWDAFWWAFITLTTGGGDRPTTVVSRIFAMVWVLTGLLAVSSLTAGITTWLTVQHLSGGVSNYRDLVGMRVGLAEGTTMARFAEENGLPFQRFPDTSDVLAGFENGVIEATILDAPVAQYYALHRGAGEAALAGPVFAADKLGIAFPNGSPLREQVNRALLEIMEEGVLERLRKRYFAEN